MIVCYAIATRKYPLRLRYVGVTRGTMRHRFGQHHHDRFNERKRRWLNSVHAICFPLSYHKTWPEAVAAEQQWIAELRPTYKLLNGRNYGAPGWQEQLETWQRWVLAEAQALGIDPLTYRFNGERPKRWVEWHPMKQLNGVWTGAGTFFPLAALEAALAGNNQQGER